MSNIRSPLFRWTMGWARIGFCGWDDDDDFDVLCLRFVGCGEGVGAYYQYRGIM